MFTFIGIILITSCQQILANKIFHNLCENRHIGTISNLVLPSPDLVSPVAYLKF